MPIHDWSRVESGIFHDFHLSWIYELRRALNSGVLPPDYYALAEQHAGRLEPDVLTLRGLGGNSEGSGGGEPEGQERGGGLKLARPKLRVTAETDVAFYRRKQRSVVVRHVSGDHVVAMIEIVSPGNKDSRRALDQFVDKVGWLLEHNVHLLIVDLHRPTARDPNGIHGAIWDAIAGQSFEPPADKPLTLASYERDVGFRAYVEPVAVGDTMPDMPLFLVPGGHVLVPLETTYQAAWGAVPRRWQRVVTGDE
jgi:Protein of unknown function (DUF4058)